MYYEGAVYRPPSEAYSLIIQLTIGCARNKCTFCYMYKAKKFRVRPIEEVIADLEECQAYYGNHIKKIFLADGDALIVKTDDLIRICDKIKELFPRIQRISAYAAPKDILVKTPEELRRLKEAGLTMLYIGVESGDDEVLTEVQKGVTSEEMIAAGIKAKEAGMVVSMTVINGLGGKDKMEQHAINSARVLSAIKPHYAALLTLMVEPGTPLYEEVKSGRFKMLTPEEVLLETKIFLEHMDSEGTVFRSNHASNYVSLAGTLNQDTERMIGQLDRALKFNMLKPEEYRGF